MSTFLVGLVVAAATVFVTAVALSDPDQPPTIRRPTGRERPPRRRRAHPDPVATPRTATPPGRPTTPLERPTRRRPERARRPRREPARAWIRLRSGFALVVLVTFVGMVVAVTTGASLALAARALRHAVG